MAASLDRERAVELEDLDLPPAGRRVRARLALRTHELVAEEARRDEAEIRPRRMVLLREDLGRGEDGVAGLERGRVAARRVDDVAEGVVADVGAGEAEAERERRAVIITAEGEKAAAAAVAEAAGMLSKIPGGINIRTLQTLEKISVEPSQKTLVVLPSELTNLKDLLK